MKFLIDVNLPRKFSFFNSEEFIHVTDIDPKMNDRAIWEYAKKNGLVILTKDADFYHRSMLDESGPVVVYFKLGNKTLSSCMGLFSLAISIRNAKLYSYEEKGGKELPLR